MKYEKGAFVTLPNVHKLRELTLGARATFTEVCVYADSYGKCFPSRNTIAKNLDMHPNSIDRFLAELVEKGLLQKEARYRKDGGQTSNEYQIIVIPLHTGVTTPSNTHSEAELYPLVTKPTSLSANAEIVSFEIVSDLEVEPKPLRKKKVTPEIEAVFKLFDNPAKSVWKLREVERVAAQSLFDTYGPDTLSIRLARIKKEKEKGDPYFPEVNTPSQLLDKMPNIERYLSI